MAPPAARAPGCTGPAWRCTAIPRNSRCCGCCWKHVPNNHLLALDGVTGCKGRPLLVMWSQEGVWAQAPHWTRLYTCPPGQCVLRVLASGRLVLLSMTQGRCVLLEVTATSPAGAPATPRAHTVYSGAPLGTSCNCVAREVQLLCPADAPHCLLVVFQHFTPASPSPPSSCPSSCPEGIYALSFCRFQQPPQGAVTEGAAAECTASSSPSQQQWRVHSTLQPATAAAAAPTATAAAAEQPATAAIHVPGTAPAPGAATAAQDQDKKDLNEFLTIAHVREADSLAAERARKRRRRDTSRQWAEEHQQQREEDDEEQEQHAEGEEEEELEPRYGIQEHKDGRGAGASWERDQWLSVVDLWQRRVIQHSSLGSVRFLCAAAPPPAAHSSPTTAQNTSRFLGLQWAEDMLVAELALTVAGDDVQVGLRHRCTFAGLGYVQEAKPNRKFLLLADAPALDCALLAEPARYVTLYDRPGVDAAVAWQRLLQILPRDAQLSDDEELEQTYVNGLLLLPADSGAAPSEEDSARTAAPGSRTVLALTGRQLLHIRTAPAPPQDQTG
eukprot:g55602.t1